MPAPRRTSAKFADAKTVRAKAAAARRASGTSRDEGATEAYQRTREQRADGGVQAVEQLIEVPSKVRLDVQDRQPEHEQKAGQHEPETREEAAELAATDASEIHA